MVWSLKTHLTPQKGKMVCADVAKPVQLILKPYPFNFVFINSSYSFPSKVRYKILFQLFECIFEGTVILYSPKSGFFLLCLLTGGILKF